MAKLSPTIVITGVAVLGLGVLIAVVAGGRRKLPPKQGDKPGDKPDDSPADADEDAPQGDLRTAPFTLPNVALVDVRQKAPKEIVRRARKPGDIRAVVLHQTGFTWQPDNPKWPEVKSHFTVMQDGQVYLNHHPEEQLKYGSSHANPFGITIEHEGNYPSAAGKWFMPEKFGANKLQEHPEQWKASRALVAGLKAAYPSITHVYAHRQWESPKKANCPGPDIWRAVGEWSKKMLGLKDGGEDWHYTGGESIPAAWKEPWPA